MAKQTDSFFNTDFTQIMDQFQFPGIDPQIFVNAQRRNFEALTAANQLAAEGLREVARRQSEIVREGVEVYAGAVREMLATGDAEDKAARQAELAKAGYETAVANAQELSQLMVKAQSEAFEVINKRVTEGLDEFKVVIGKDAAVKATAAKNGNGSAPKSGSTPAKGGENAAAK